ncbi:hypothetical protein GOHSU_68_00090 [Gordonia hirsuta DSM 44140 = NBRC 16056]|uniref:Competence protein n=1 Tax=Gordonia hirsuta DSM 44140 = NBRC 16056 TaxID=1121927 RepID=L7LG13_9ACTN|nr:hypothetical protein [Gordonia hirsuta]GAC59017.1 hypothetical protein GOHSU_68_00090 [Gordonia hirsuta DSM 44140 = NBRC 16056]
MRYALSPTGDLITATPGAAGVCRGCGGGLIPKCGGLTAWHWAHLARDCDQWAEPDNSWHLDWQSAAPADRVEVTIGPHRADILTPDGRVVEVQHSPISAAAIVEREQFYGPMAWIFDAREAFAAERLILYRRPTWAGFRWKHARRSVLACSRPVFLDCGGDLLFRVRRIGIDTRGRCTGWGTVGSARDFRVWLAGPAGAVAA